MTTEDARPPCFKGERPYPQCPFKQEGSWPGGGKRNVFIKEACEDCGLTRFVWEANKAKK
jgi:hypothetical protein